MPDVRTLTWLGAVGAAALAGACLATAPLETAAVSALPTERPSHSPAPAPSATAGQRTFAAALLRDATPIRTNTALSPFSIRAALSMTAAGARGETRAQIDRVAQLGADDAAHAEYSRLHAALLDRPGVGISLGVANRLYVEQTFELVPAMIETTRQSYRAVIEQRDFAGDAARVRDDVNRWVLDQTHGHIADLLPPSAVTARTKLLLVNAVAFEGKWQSPFDPQRTIDRDFFAAAGVRKVKTMHETTLLRYLDAAGAQWVRLAYGDGTVDLIVGVPSRRDGIDELVGRLDTALFERLQSPPAALVALALPRFTFEYQLPLREVLMRLGVVDAFACAAPSPVDLSGIGGAAGELCISSALHKSFVALDEAGTKAYAASYFGADVVNDAAIEPPRPIRVVADHPFLFAIEHVPTRSLLFLGVIAAP